MNENLLDKGYEPHDVEQRWYEFWEKEGLFAAKEDVEGNCYSIVIPPPNVTGVLHMGHALNITMQDILCRYRKLRGDNVLWMPGTDHAGIATQNVVEKKLDLDDKGYFAENVHLIFAVGHAGDHVSSPGEKDFRQVFHLQFLPYFPLVADIRHP